MSPLQLSISQQGTTSFQRCNDVVWTSCACWDKDHLFYFRCFFNFHISISLISAIPYTVRISTGDKQEHETQASAFIVFIGTQAVSDKIDLDLIGKEKFSAGSIETFSVESPDVGDLKKIEVRFVFIILKCVNLLNVRVVWVTKFIVTVKLKYQISMYSIVYNGT